MTNPMNRDEAVLLVENALHRLYSGHGGPKVTSRLLHDFAESAVEALAALRSGGGEGLEVLRAERDAALEAARAWRSRFVCERMNAYPNDAYEVCRAKAEDSANQFEDAFNAARVPKENES